jgi:hypothetical protein
MLVGRASLASNTPSPKTRYVFSMLGLVLVKEMGCALDEDDTTALYFETNNMGMLTVLHTGMATLTLGQQDRDGWYRYGKFIFLCSFYASPMLISCMFLRRLFGTSRLQQ